MAMPVPLQLHLTLPAWVHDLGLATAYPGDEAKVALGIELARRNVEAGTGGPFGAAVFDGHDRVVSLGVNRVLPQSCSVAHAENMAYMLAQQRLQRSRLNVPDGAFTLAGVGPMTTPAGSGPMVTLTGSGPTDAFRPALLTHLPHPLPAARRRAAGGPVCAGLGSGGT